MCVEFFFFSVRENDYFEKRAMWDCTQPDLALIVSVSFHGVICTLTWLYWHRLPWH